jgi:hypothetical protein
LKVPLLISQNYYCLMLSYGLVKHLVHFFFYLFFLYHPVLSCFDFIHSLDIISVVNIRYLLVFLIQKQRKRERENFMILKRLFRFRYFLNDGRLIVVRLHFFLEKET